MYIWSIIIFDIIYFFWKKIFILNNFDYILLFCNIYIICKIILASLYLISKFAICRFLTGVSVGGEYSCMFVMIDEFVPKKYRG